MACLQTRVPVLRMSMTILMVSLTVGKGLDIKQPDHCRAVCSNYGKPDCITLNQGEVDFKTAEEACHDRKGELLQLCSKSDKRLFDILSQELFGNYWIGLHLPAGACSNLSAPLRGYKWISGRPGITFLPSWNNHIQLCSPHCVSLSSDEKWTERPCLDKADGFLCKVELQDACRGQEVSHPTLFQSYKGCSSGPCEQNCEDFKGGYTCSCFKQYIPDNKDPRQCKPHCAQKRCPSIQEAGYDICPEGFLKVDGNFCEDPNEGPVTTPPVVAFVKPPISNNTLKASSVPGVRFLWVLIVVIVVVIASIFVIRFYVVKRNRQRENSNRNNVVT